MKSKIHDYQNKYLIMSKHRILAVLVMLLISMGSFAQAIGTGINYKAVIKDDLGNIIAGQNINVRFTILDEDANSYYQESHNPTTDANGVIVLSIGDGTIISGVFYGLEWRLNLYELQVEIDIENDGTFVTFDPTPFQKVPYASFAQTSYLAEVAQTANNVTGLEQITEGSNTGWRLIGKLPEDYGLIGDHAVDLSYSTSNSTSMGATGLNAFAVGKNARASGDNSMAIGPGTTAEGEGSVAMGISNVVEPNALFTIGQGPYNTFKNAMVIYKNGTSKFYEDMSVNRWLTVEGLFIANDGMSLTGKLQRGTSSDMIPLIYGSVSSTGTIYTSSGSFTVTKDTSHTYTITVLDDSFDGVSELSHTNSSTSVTPISGAFRTSNISHSNGRVRIHIFDSSFGQVANSFQFVIYKQ
jgi:hypothetical protein